jgi:hypothetical protein
MVLAHFGSAPALSRNALQHARKSTLVRSLPRECQSVSQYCHQNMWHNQYISVVCTILADECHPRVARDTPIGASFLDSARRDQLSEPEMGCCKPEPRSVGVCDSDVRRSVREKNQQSVTRWRPVKEYESMGDSRDCRKGGEH